MSYNSRTKRIMVKFAYLKNIVWGTIKMVLAFPLKSVMMFISSFYTLGIGIARRRTVKKKQYKEYSMVGVLVILSSIAYILYSLFRSIKVSNTKYSLVISICIATVSFIDIIIAIVGVIRTRKSTNIQARVYKLLNLATSFPAISLTQYALLSVCTKENTSRVNGIFGAIMGMLSLIVGIYIVVYINKNKKKAEKVVKLNPTTNEE